MKLLLLSGGSGKRLWPLSNDSRSKQFLKVLQNSQGELESMVQRVWRQITAGDLHHSSYIATSLSQVDILRNQIGLEPSYIVEPERRDTFPAIALSAVYLYDKCNVSADESLCVLPVDPFVEDVFFENVVLLDRILQANGADIALIGVEPSHPSEKYGYIVPDDQLFEYGESRFYKVNKFVEKPEESNAAKMISQGALWNCGVFAFRLGFLLAVIERMGLPLQYDEFLKQYATLPKKSFDYEVLEKASNIAVMPYKGQWKDLGTWNTLTEEMSSNSIGNSILAGVHHNTHVINELDIPVTVLGTSDIIVAASPDGILVADKSISHRVKDWVGELGGHPMYVEKGWGWYKVVDYREGDNKLRVLTKRVFVGKGYQMVDSVYDGWSRNITVISGKGSTSQNGVTRIIQAGDHFTLAANERFDLLAIDSVEMIVTLTSHLEVEKLVKGYR
ncbi:sugar phosphate nucleotidyltransferase [Paenibacillus aurantiacus]|uniref:Sugar phosphate nucleotidyltransferase n=1 Tax=Paenibacillus aurantiacus TaxID=1936118 RepID=A0ABV5KNY5_9BACL